MNRIILHIGLHKTATKFYQHHVFPFLDKKKFNYNPSKLTQYVMDYIKADETDKSSVLKYVEEEKDTLLVKDDRTIVISREIMSGDLFSAYADWGNQTSLLHRAFPDAEIIISLRYQPNWLVSCYRESLHEHHYQPIEKFLCISKTGEFEKPKSRKNNDGFAQLYALNLDYNRMLETLYSFFDRKKVLVMFFENLKKNREAQIRKVLSFIGSEEVDVKPVDGIPNRGYSANSIEMSIARYQEYKGTNMERKIHRPIFFFGPGSIPAGNIELSVLDKDTYWGEQFLRDSQEVRSPNYPKLSDEESEKLKDSWRFKVKNIIDPIYYYDWDLLSDYREPLNDWYKKSNSELKDILNAEKIPSIYCE